MENKLKRYTVKLFLGILLVCSLMFLWIKSQNEGPFFWIAEKNGKKIYMLGTLHYGVALHELQCFDEIVIHLSEVDFVFTEMMESTFLQSQLDLKKNTVSKTGQAFQNLKKKSQKFLGNKFGHKYLKNMNYYGLNSVLQYSCFSDVFSSNDKLKKKMIDSMQNEDSLMDVEVQKIAQSKGIPQGDLDDLSDIEYILKEKPPLSITAEDIDKRISNYDEYCSPKNIIEYLKLFLSRKKKYISGKNIIRIYEKQKNVKGILKDLSEGNINIMMYNSEFLLKHRNEKWLPKILEAFNNYNNIFITAGLFHFITDYNLLDILKTEGFSIKRFKTNCK